MTPILSDEKQALFHFGCSCRHVGQGFAALWRSSWFRLLGAALIVAIALCFTGCSSTGGFNPLRSWFGRKAAAEQKAEVKAGVLEDKTVDAAQVEVVKTGIALEAAPPSRPVEVAKRTNDNAEALLNQRKPLNAATLAEVKTTVAGLLSVETAKREAAEKAQLATEKQNQTLSQELEQTRADLKELAKARAVEAANNLELANQLRWANIVKYAGIAASTLLSLAVIAYRLNIGRLQTGAAEVLAKLQASHPEAATTARSALDAILHTGEQRGVAKAFFNLTQS